MKYHIGDKFHEPKFDHYHLIVDTLESGERPIIFERQDNKYLFNVSERDIDNWLKDGSLVQIEHGKLEPCIYCQSKVEQSDKYLVCTECYRVQE